MGAGRLARKHPSGLLLSQCGRKHNGGAERCASAGAAAEDRESTAVPRASARQRVPGRHRAQPVCPVKGPQHGHSVPGSWRGSGQNSRARGPNHAGRKEGRGTEGLRNHTPSLFRVAGAAPLLCRRGRGSVFGGAGSPFLGKREVALPAKGSTVRAQLAKPGCNRTGGSGGGRAGDGKRRQLPGTGGGCSGDGGGEGMSGPGVFGERRCRVVWGCRGHPRGSLGAERERREAAAGTGPEPSRPLLTSAGPTPSLSDPGLGAGARCIPARCLRGAGWGHPAGTSPLPVPGAAAPSVLLLLLLPPPGARVSAGAGALPSSSASRCRRPRAPPPRPRSPPRRATGGGAAPAPSAAPVTGDGARGSGCGRRLHRAAAAAAAGERGVPVRARCAAPPPPPDAAFVSGERSRAAAAAARRPARAPAPPLRSALGSGRDPAAGGAPRASAPGPAATDGERLGPGWGEGRRGEGERERGARRRSCRGCREPRVSRAARGGGSPVRWQRHRPGAVAVGCRGVTPNRALTPTVTATQGQWQHRGSRPPAAV